MAVTPVGTPESDAVEVTLDVSGMTCATCAQSIEKTLRQTPGVEAVSVNLLMERAAVRFDQRRATLSDLRDAVTGLGYGVRQEEARWTVAGLDEDVIRRRVADLLERGRDALGVAAYWQNAATGLLTVSLVRGVGDRMQVDEALKRAGLVATLLDDAAPGVAPEARRAGRQVAVAVLYSIPVWVYLIHALTDMGPPWFGIPLVAAVAATLVEWGPGWGFIRRAVMNLRHGNANMDVLVALGTLAAWGLSLYDWIVGGPLYFDVPATIITLVLLGKWLEARAKHETGRALSDLLDLEPPETVRWNGATWESVDTSHLLRADRIRIGPGERFPTDGMVTVGRSEVDASLVTGETALRAVGPRDSVQAGTLNGTGVLEVEVTEAGRETSLRRLVHLVEQAQASKAPVERVVDRVANVFVPIVLGAALVTLLVWGVHTGDWRHAVLTAVAVVVVACPCALGLATPTALMVASGTAARRGILFRRGEVLEQMAGITVAAFDKTGTLTSGRPRLVAVHPDALGEEDEVLGWAAALQTSTTHPLGRAIWAAAQERGVAVPAADGVYTEPGLGMVGELDGDEVLAGNRELLEQYGVESPAEGQEAAADGSTRVWVARAGRLAGVLELRDTVRDDAPAMMRRLWRLGITPVMLSGDGAGAAQAVARAVGVERVEWGLLPQDKVERVRRLRHEGARVLMVGDGINDAGALAEADVAVAVENAAHAAVESAGVTLARPDISAVVEALTIGRAAMGKIRQNLIWALAYNVVLIPLAAFGILSPIVSAAAMALSSVAVVTNSLTLRRSGGAGQPREASGVLR